MGSAQVEASQTGNVCIPNIGAKGQRRRRGVGHVMAAISLLLTAGLLLAGTARPWRLVVALPIAIMLLGYLQAREKT